MCSINHEMKAIYIHVPKNGGLYVQNILEKYYGFKTLYFTRQDHHLFDKYDKTDFNKKNYKNIVNGFINIKKFGVLTYYKTSVEHDKLMDMSHKKWNDYYKFTFLRNPYTKIVSAYKYLVENSFIPFEEFIDNKDLYNNYVYTHAFISQFEHIMNEEKKINLDYVGKFENLNNDLVEVLFKIGFDKIKHANIIKKNIKINKGGDSNYHELYDQNILNKINIIFNLDFKNFFYDQINDINDFHSYFISLTDDFQKNNQLLYQKLQNEDKIYQQNNIEISLDNNINLKIEPQEDEDFFNYNNLYNKEFILSEKKEKIKNYMNNVIDRLFSGLKPIEQIKTENNQNNENNSSEFQNNSNKNNNTHHHSNLDDFDKLKIINEKIFKNAKIYHEKIKK